MVFEMFKVEPEAGLSMKLAGIASHSMSTRLEETDFMRVYAALPAPGPQGPWLAGGSLRRLITGNRELGDFDYFFRDKDQLVAFQEMLDALGFKLKYTNEHNSTYTGAVGETEVIVQAIFIRYYATVQALLDSFDFTLCQLAYDGSLLHLGEYTLWDVGRKRLAVHRITYPVSTLRRLLKYTNQGYYACSGCLQSIAEGVHDIYRTSERREIQYLD